MIAEPVHRVNNQGNRLLRRFRDGSKLVRGWFFTDMRGSIHVSLRVEHSLALLATYTVIGGVFAFYLVR